MFVRRNKRQVPGVNTASTADISFMLLIFFLVTTSMDVDKGLFRLLPSPEPQKQLKTETIVDKNTLMALHVTADHRLLLNDKPIEVSRLKGEIIQFVNRLGNRHLISIESDREADYDLYFQMQNQIMMAYNELRNQYSMKHFGKAFDALSSSQKESVRKNCQQRVTESYANASVGSDKRVGAMAEEQEHSEEKGGKQ
nr:biopolymer transporter ExbD [Prevotella sp.]